ncbi:MAG TPA: hypothetical protein DEB05_00875, partial [Firmicutes bacterium]|nr:hypothetical protein [Bacillota bacterium]
LKIEKELAIAEHRISDLNLERFTIVAVIRDGKALIPRGNTKLLPKDKIFVLGETRGFQNLNDLIKTKTPVFKRII